MKYMGSKARFANELLPIILKDRKEGQWYVEPFCGGCNMIDKVTGNRMACDNNPFLIAMWDELINNKCFVPKTHIDKEYYSRMKEKYNENKSGKWLGSCEKAEIGWVGFMGSFNGKFFNGGYSGHNVGKRDYISEQIKNTSSQIPYLKGVIFRHSDYKDIELPRNSIIYCDPPYANTTRYAYGLNHEEFWHKCREWVKDGHKVFVSEYHAPSDWVCVWEKKIKTALNQKITKDAVERLFVHETQYQKEEQRTTLFDFNENR